MSQSTLDCVWLKQKKEKLVALKFTTLLAMEEVLTPTNSATHNEMSGKEKTPPSFKRINRLEEHKTIIIAVYEERFSPANATVITMELLFWSLKQDKRKQWLESNTKKEENSKHRSCIYFFYIIIKELADIAEVFSHVDTTVGANLSYLYKTTLKQNPKCHTRAILISVWSS